MLKTRVIIMGAAGRDFHNFNVYFRNNPSYEVVAFTATQIPGIEERMYPPELAGSNYPNGIPIYPEEELPELIKKFNVDLTWLFLLIAMFPTSMLCIRLQQSLQPEQILGLWDLKLQC